MFMRACVSAYVCVRGCVYSYVACVCSFNFSTTNTSGRRPRVKHGDQPTSRLVPARWRGPRLHTSLYGRIQLIKPLVSACLNRAHLVNAHKVVSASLVWRHQSTLKTRSNRMFLYRWRRRTGGLMYARRKTIKRHRPRWSPPIRWGRPSPQTHCSETKQRAQHNASEPPSRWKQTTMETVMKSTVKTALLVAVMCSVLLTTSHANFYGKRSMYLLPCFISVDYNWRKKQNIKHFACRCIRIYL